MGMMKLLKNDFVRSLDLTLKYELAEAAAAKS